MVLRIKKAHYQESQGHLCVKVAHNHQRTKYVCKTLLPEQGYQIKIDTGAV